MAIEYDIVFLNREPSISKIILENGDPVSLSAVTRAVIVLTGDTNKVIDSDISGGVFDWSGTTEYPAGSGEMVDVLEADLSGETLTIGKYPGSFLVLFDSVHTAGLVFNLAVEIKADPLA